MEKMTALCSKCKCCLADDTHCWNCHVEKSIDDLCDCGQCKLLIKDFLEREEARRLRGDYFKRLKRETAVS